MESSSPPPPLLLIEPNGFERFPPLVALSECVFGEFDYPFNAFKNGNGLWNVNGEEASYDQRDNLIKSVIDAGIFNTDDYESLWIYEEGENDSEDWELVGKLKNGMYFSFNASCDYTGFDCQGGGAIDFSKDGHHFWNFGLDENQRERIQNRV